MKKENDKALNKEFDNSEENKVDDKSTFDKSVLDSVFSDDEIESERLRNFRESIENSNAKTAEFEIPVKKNPDSDSGNTSDNIKDTIDSISKIVEEKTSSSSNIEEIEPAGQFEESTADLSDEDSGGKTYVFDNENTSSSLSSRLSVLSDDKKLMEAFSDDKYDMTLKGIIDSDNRKKNKTEKKKRASDSMYDENGERLPKENPFDSPEFSYTSSEQTESVFSALKSKIISSSLSMISVMLVLMLSLYLEFAPSLGLFHLPVLESGKTGIIFILADLQLMFLAAIIKFDSLYKGYMNIIFREYSPESCAILSTVFVTIHSIVNAVFKTTYSDVVLLGSVGCLFIFILSVYDYIKSRTEFISFRVASSDSEKFIIKDVTYDADDKLSYELKGFVPEKSGILDARKTEFVSNFFEAQTKHPSSDKNIGAIMLVSVIVSLLASVGSYIVNPDIYVSFCAFITILLSSIPINSFLTSSLPNSLFTKFVSKRRCAFLGENVSDLFDNTAIISFSDTEVFKPKDVKVTSIRTYGDSRIDNVIVLMARIFRKVGGPLSEVFTNSVTNLQIDEDIKLIDIAPDGLWFDIDKKNVYLGTSSYMKENHFDVPADVMDNSFRQSGYILYLACENSLSAKFYIKYTISPSFESILRSLHGLGICAGIKTLDPCINNDFIRANLRRPEAIFSVVKATNAEDIQKCEKTYDSSIVSCGTEYNLLQAFILSFKMKTVVRINNVIKIVSVLIGLAFTALLTVLGGISIPSYLIIILQLFWTMPVILTSVLSGKH